jgi:hypothetical protein
MPDKAAGVMLSRLLKQLLIFPKGLLGGIVFATVMWTAIISYHTWHTTSSARKLGHRPRHPGRPPQLEDAEAAGRTLAAIGPPKWGFPFVPVGVSETGMKAALHRTMEQTCARADCTVVLTHENRDNTLPVEI